MLGLLSADAPHIIIHPSYNSCFPHAQVSQAIFWQLPPYHAQVAHQQQLGADAMQDLTAVRQSDAQRMSRDQLVVADTNFILLLGLNKIRLFEFVLVSLAVDFGPLFRHITQLFQHRPAFQVAP